MVCDHRLVTMNATHDLMQDHCQRCGRLRMQSARVLSRHTTSEGVIVYTQCVCGLLDAWLYPLGANATVVADGTS